VNRCRLCAVSACCLSQRQGIDAEILCLAANAHLHIQVYGAVAKTGVAHNLSHNIAHMTDLFFLSITREAIPG